MWFTCFDVEKIHDYDCCTSCHEDEEMYDGTYMSEQSYKNHTLSCCCNCPDLTEGDWNILIMKRILKEEKG